MKVNIYGKEYTVKGKADPSYIESVAQYVDSKMKEVDTNAPFQSSLRVAILAAMNITDELFSYKKERGEILSTYEQKAKNLCDLIDKNLSDLKLK
ncbi:MAG: cell division protein ZapA [Fidelibacterota bacterium]